MRSGMRSRPAGSICEIRRLCYKNWTMRASTAILALVLIVSVAVLAPGAAEAEGCDEVEAGDACGLDCVLCLCCSYLHTTAAVATAPGAFHPRVDDLLDGGPDLPPEPHPRGILHVPRSTVSH